MFRKPVKEVSSSTRLVQQLYSFGLEDDHNSSSSPSSPVPSASTSTSTLAPAIPTLTRQLDDLALARTAPAPAPKVNAALRKLLKSTQHVVRVGEPARERVLTSWKMADYAYKRDPCPFPTRARGLFTEKVESPSSSAPDQADSAHDEYRIVARGYDKFFNVNEVSWTQWDKIPEFSTGPYELTLKSNGCIILIAALSENDLIVTSKHSIGKNANLATEGSVSHSERGEYWLERHLESAGKTKRELASELLQRNLTAVAELCDDSFEEHVLPYPTEQTGLHLHGLNHNTPVLDTLPSSDVSQFAQRFGMIATAYFVFPSVVAVRTYCETVEAAGGIEFTPGHVTPVEGFVVRGKRRGGERGEAFFWKVKYDEPYLMYREWRELTRKCLTAHALGTLEESVDPKRVKNPESRLYLWWVKREIARDVGKFDSWKFGKGMIKTREEFIEWEKTGDGRSARRQLGEVVQLDEEEKKHRKFDKTIVVPIAVQGCGKTALGLELSQLFGFAHVQSDDFLVKKPTPHFLRKIKELLKDHDVVFADKNNHQVKHRQDLVNLVDSLSSQYRIRLVALVYPIDSPTLPRDKFHALMSSRIVARGENHQTLRAGALHEAAIWQFLGQHERFDPVANASTDARFDHVVEMRPEGDRDEQLEQVVKELVNIDGMSLEDPGVDARRRAIEWAMDWKVQVKRSSATDDQPSAATKGKGGRKNNSKPPRYYGLSVRVNLHELVNDCLATAAANGVGSVVALRTEPDSIWNQLVKASRVEPNPHVTLVHQFELQPPPPPPSPAAAGEEGSGGGEDEAATKARNEKQRLWNKYERMVRRAAEDEDKESTLVDEARTRRRRELLQVEITLGPRLVWNDRVMSIEVSSLSQPVRDDEEKQQQGDDEDESISLVQDRSAHITVGTRSSDIRPVEGKWLMEQALAGQRRGPGGEGDAGPFDEIRIDEIKVRATLAGLS